MASWYRFAERSLRLRTLGGLLAAALLAAPLVPGDAAAQVAGAQSLQIPPGARAEGGGRFFTAVANDAFAPWWNPAGLAFMRGFNAGLMHAQLVPGLADDVYFEYAGASTYLEGWGGVAATLTYLSYGESFATREGSGGDPFATFSSFEISPSIAIGTPILPNLGVGMNLKLVHVNLAPGSVVEGGGDAKGTTFAADVGALYTTTSPKENLLGMGPANLNFGLGVSVANMGPNISLADKRDSDPLPRNLKIAATVGASAPESFSIQTGFAIEKSLIFEDIPDSVATELSYFERNEVLVSGGVEFGYNDLAFVRAGYLYDDPGEIKGMTYGAGFYLQKFGIDIASIPQYRELQRVTKFSIVLRLD